MLCLLFLGKLKPLHLIIQPNCKGHVRDAYEGTKSKDSQKSMWHINLIQKAEDI